MPETSTRGCLASELRAVLIASLREQTDIDSLLAPGVLNALFKQLKQEVKTNIPPRELAKLLALAQDINLDKRRTLVLSPPTCGTECYPCPPDGLYILEANIPKIRQATENVFKNREG